MAKEYGRLFFYYNECEKSGNLEEAKRVSEHKAQLLKKLKDNGYNVGEMVEQLKIKKIFQKEYETVIVFSDGGVRNNHDNEQKSLAASAYAVYADQQLVHHEAVWIGQSISLPSGETVDISSTLAEYHGLLQALTFIEENEVKAQRIIYLTDCASMVQHVTKQIPSHPLLTDYAQDLWDRLHAHSNIQIKYIPREQNKVTDRLVNQLIDEHERSELRIAN